MNEKPDHAGPLSTEFHFALAAIFEQVRGALFKLPNRRTVAATPDRNFDIAGLHGRIRAGLSDETPPRRLCKAILAHCERLLAELGQQPLDGASQDVVEEQMENLAGAWLGLYFLGVPFVHPWAPVAHHAERNGYYRGAGICKATGDVYREARKSPRAGGPRTRAETDAVVVLDHNPLAIRHLIAAVNPAPRVVIAALGACYELLQLRLYIRSGGVIRHVVFDSTVARRLATHQGGMARLDDLPAQPAIEEMWEMASQCYEIGTPTRRRLDEGRLTIIKPDKDIAQMPACVLSRSNGVFRSQIRLRDDNRTVPEVHYGANGNRLPDTQHALFRSLLLARKRQPGDFVVTSATRTEFEAFCQHPLGVRPPGIERRRNRAEPTSPAQNAPPTPPSVH